MTLVAAAQNNSFQWFVCLYGVFSTWRMWRDPHVDADAPWSRPQEGSDPFLDHKNVSKSGSFQEQERLSAFLTTMTRQQRWELRSLKCQPLGAISEFGSFHNKVRHQVWLSRPKSLTHDWGSDRSYSLPPTRGQIPNVWVRVSWQNPGSAPLTALSRDNKRHTQRKCWTWLKAERLN